MQSAEGRQNKKASGITALFGFRHNKGWHRIIACVWYIIAALVIFMGIMTRTPVSVIVGAFLLSPLFLLHDTIRDKIPLFRKRKVGFTILGFLAAYAVAMLLCWAVEPKVSKADRQAAAQVDSLIDDIGEVSLDNAEQIKAAERAYDALSEEQKAIVKNEDTLQADVASLNDLTDQKAAADVDNLITAVGEVTYEKVDQVEAAQTAYNALTDQQKSLVTHTDLLEAEIEELKNSVDQYEADAQAAASVDEAIRKVAEASDGENGKPSEAFAAVVDDALASYEKLSSDQKKLVKEYGVLEKTEAYIASYQAGEVQKLIDAAMKNGKGYDKAEEAYEKLSDTAKTYVMDYDAFKATKDRYDYIQSAQTVSYNDLRKYPDTYEGTPIKLKLTLETVEPDGLIFNGDVIGVVSGTSNEVAVYDSRSVREPRFVEGDTITLYGDADGLVKLKQYIKGSGLLGSDLFARTVDEYEVPCIRVKYTSEDVAIQTSGTPSSDSAYERGQKAADDLADSLESLDWDKEQSEAREKGQELAEKLNRLIGAE